MPTEAPSWEETEEVSAPNWADTQALESPIPSPLEFQGPPLPPPSPPPATMRTAGLRERLGLGPLGDILGVGRGVQRELQREAGGGVPTPKELVDVGFQFTTVPPQLAKPIEKITDVPINLLPPTAAGAVQGVRDIALQVPWAAGVVGMGKRAGDLLYGAFLADFLLQVPQAYEQYKALRAQGRNQEAARLAVSQVGTGLLMGAGLKRHQEIRAGGRVDPERAKLANDILELDAAVPGTLDAAKGLIQRQAPETQRQAPAVPVVPVAPPKREETPVAPVAPAEPTAAAKAVAAAGQVPEAAAAVIPEARALPAQAAAEASARAAEISKPAWVINLEAVEKAGNLNEAQAVRLAKWRKENQPAAVEAAKPDKGLGPEGENAWMSPAIGRYQLLSRKDMQVLVTQDAQYPEMIRATYLVNGEPTGHQLFRSLSDLKQATSNSVKIPQSKNPADMPLDDYVLMRTTLFGDTKEQATANWNHFAEKQKQPTEVQNAPETRIEQESRQSEHPGVAQRPAVSPDQPEVRQVEGGQAGGGNRPIGEPKKEGEVLLTPELMTPKDRIGSSPESNPMSVMQQHLNEARKAIKEGKPISAELARSYEILPEIIKAATRYKYDPATDQFVPSAERMRVSKKAWNLIAAIDAGDIAQKAKGETPEISSARRNATQELAKEMGFIPTKEPLARDWDLFSENLADDLESFADTRGTGKRDYDMQDVADRFVDYAKQDKSGKPLDELVSDFAKSDEASAGQIRKLRQSVKSVMASETPKAPVAEPGGEPVLKIGDDARIMGVDSVLADSKTVGGVRYELFNGARLKENRAAIRITDEDTGKVVTLKQHPTFDSAEKEFKDVLGKATKSEEPPAPKPKEAWEKSLREFQIEEGRTNWGLGERIANFVANEGDDPLRPSQRALDKIAGVLGYSKADIRRALETYNWGDKGLKEIDWKKYHKAIVQQALREGKPVPPEVLKDYPELDKKGRTPERQELLDKMAAKVKEATSEQGAMEKPTTPAEGVGKGELSPHEVTKRGDIFDINGKKLVSVGGQSSKRDALKLLKIYKKDGAELVAAGGKYIVGVPPLEPVKIPFGEGRFRYRDAFGNWSYDDPQMGGKTSVTDPKTKAQWDQEVSQPPPTATEGGGKVPPTGPGLGAGPGAAGAGWADVAMQRLKEGIEALPKSDAKQKLAWADRWADMEGRGRDLADRMTLKMAAVNASVRDSMRGVRSPTELGRKVGELDYLLQRSSAISHNTAEAMRKQMPSEDVRAGLWLYADAHGDLNAIRDTIATMPSDTPANVKRALNAALNLTPKEKAWLPLVRDYFDNRAAEAQAAGVLNNALDDYFTHIWRVKDNMPAGIQSALNRGAISEYFQFARERKLPIILEGIKNPGMIPGKRLEPVLDAAKVMPYYNYAMDRAIASREFIRSLSDLTASDGRPLVSPTGVRSQIPDPSGTGGALLIKPKVRPEEVSDYRALDHPSMRKWNWAGKDDQGRTVFYQGDLVVHPEVFPRLANMMDRSRLTPSAVTKAALKYSGELKAAKLGMLSTFHLLHVGKHAIFHWTNPFAAAVRNPIDWESPQVRFAVERGHLKLAPEPGEINALSEGLGAAGNMLIHKVPVLGPISRAFSEWMFREYIPRLKLHTFENALQRNMAMYGPGRSTLGKVTAFGAKALTPEEIAARTGDAVNAAYGELNKYWLGKFGRDPRLQRALRLGFLAPDFGEARLRFVGKAFTKYGNEERMALFLNAALVYTAARIGNYLSTGDPQMDDPRHAFEVKVGDHWVGMRSVIADLAHAMSNFSQFMRVRLNPGLAEPLIEMLSRTNARGQPVDAMGQVKDMLRRTVPITFQGLTESDRHVWESFSSSMGLMQRRGDAVSSVHELARKWKKDRGIESPVVIHESPVGNPYREARVALEMDDEPRFWRQVQEQYRRLRLTKTEHPAKVIEQAFTRYYGMPFTGKQALEKSFLAEMEPRNRVVYQQAVQQRKEELKKFKTWWKNHEAAFSGQ